MSYGETVHVNYATEKVIKTMTRLLGAAQYYLLKFLKWLPADGAEMRFLSGQQII